MKKLFVIMLMCVIPSTALARDAFGNKASEMLIVLQSHALRISSSMLVVSTESSALPSKKRIVITQVVQALCVLNEGMLYNFNILSASLILRDSPLRKKFPKMKIYKAMLIVINDLEFFYKNLGKLSVTIKDTKKRIHFEKSLVGNYKLFQSTVIVFTSQMMESKTPKPKEK